MFRCPPFYDLAEPIGEMKTCPGCRTEKPLDDFYPKRSRGGGAGVQARCKECQKAESRARLRPYNSAYKLSVVRRKRDWFASLKRGPCADCGQTFPSVVMDWDHRDGAKKTEKLSRMVHTVGRQAILAEIAKCDLVCANCHRIRTHTRLFGGWFEHSTDPREIPAETSRTAPVALPRPEPKLPAPAAPSAVDMPAEAAVTRGAQQPLEAD